jgi:oligoribonuclease NrnB/cAMP/cGMP phosphodiesterase (DHH superfamily)
MKIKLFTHNDLDGKGCAVLAHLVTDNVDIEECSYNNVNEKVKRFIDNEEYEGYTDIFITDLSVSEEIAEKIEGLYKYIRLIDHHKTAMWLNKYDWCTVEEITNDELECGTSLFYKHISCYLPLKTDNKMLKDFVEAVRLYDTWQWKTNFGGQFAKDLNDLSEILKDNFVAEMVDKIKQNELFITDVSYHLLYYKRKDIEEYIEYKISNAIMKCDKDKNVFYVVMCDRKDCTSELGSKLLDTHDVDYAMIVYDGGIALRSKGDFDVSIIAEKNGGGGHKNAAGYKLDVLSKIL